jgi:hypothetical protein
MMFGRILISLIFAAGFQSAAMAADFGKPRVTDVRPVLGADVTMEGGVRVIRPVVLDPGPLVIEEGEAPGRMIYHGAAFYHVPSARPSQAHHKAKPEASDEPHAE